MRRRSLLVAVAALGLIAFACGGDDGGDAADGDTANNVNAGGSIESSALEDYFRAIEEVNLAQQRATGAGSLGSAGSTVAANLAFFDDTVPPLEVALDALHDIEPPDEMRELHAEYLAAKTVYLDINQQIRTRLAEAGSNFNIAELATDPVLGTAAHTAAGSDLGAACRRMQTVASANEIDIDFCLSGTGEYETSVTVTLDPESCRQLFTRARASTGTFTIFVNAGDSPIKLLNVQGEVFRELGPGEEQRREDRVWTRYRVEDTGGNCIGKFQAQFPPARVILNSP